MSQNMRSDVSPSECGRHLWRSHDPDDACPACIDEALHGRPDLVDAPLDESVHLGEPDALPPRCAHCGAYGGVSATRAEAIREAAQVTIEVEPRHIMALDTVIWIATPDDWEPAEIRESRELLQRIKDELNPPALGRNP